MLLFKVALFTLLVPGVVAGVVPYLLLRSRTGNAGGLPPVHAPAGFVLLGLGLGVYLWCAWNFAATGGGTPAPTDPPQRLVVRGLYRYVRNPMYLGVLSVLLGEAWMFTTGGLVHYALGAWLVWHVVVVGFEEPGLRRRFGAAYVEYCAHVRRWWPRLRPWSPSDAPAA
jgi:protein-S-isoprenylcysteine O-methyltransferase Ste14